MAEFNWTGLCKTDQSFGSTGNFSIGYFRTAIVVTLVVGAVTNIGKGAGAVFADISSVTDATLSAYQEMETSFDTILLNLVPSNIAADLAADNIVVATFWL